MFHHEAGYPIAVTSKDDEGVRAGIRWCFDRMEWGDRLSVWTHLKGNLANSPLLAQLVAQSADVDHVTARGGAFIRGRGPALMAWADPNDIAKFAGRNGNSITALCVVSWNERKLRPWVSAAGPELLGDTDAWRTTTPPLDPVVEQGMKELTLTINHNNTIAAGYEKDDVVSTLLALHDAGYALEGPALAGWAVAHGWTSDNPAHLERYVAAINKGTRPRIRRAVRRDFVDFLRVKADEFLRAKADEPDVD